ncbi:MAG: hypothetical protein JNL62_14715 [Bryobacterales bacterium]|nr:hypothetical protein [Bryobacterales bacterium]
MPGDTNITIRIKAPRLHSISGSIFSPAGPQFRWFEIALGRVGSNGERYLTASGQVQGSFYLGGLAAGDYHLKVTSPKTPARIFPPEWNQASTPLPKWLLIHERLIQVRDQDVSELNVALEERSAVSVTGVVQMEDGGPPPTAQMMLYRVDGESEIRSRLFRGPHEVLVHAGEYWPDLRGLPQRHAVSEILADGKKLVAPLRVASTPRSLTFVVTAGLGTLSGTVRGAEGTSPHYPAVGGFVILFQEPIGERVNDILLRISHPDQEGSFTLEGVPAGKYRAVVFTEEEGPLRRDPAYLRKRAVVAPQVEIRAGETTKVVLSR